MDTSRMIDDEWTHLHSDMNTTNRNRIVVSLIAFKNTSKVAKLRSIPEAANLGSTLGWVANVKLWDR